MASVDMVAKLKYLSTTKVYLAAIPTCHIGFKDRLWASIP